MSGGTSSVSYRRGICAEFQDSAVVHVIKGIQRRASCPDVAADTEIPRQENCSLPVPDGTRKCQTIGWRVDEFALEGATASLAAALCLATRCSPATGRYFTPVAARRPQDVAANGSSAAST